MFMKRYAFLSVYYVLLGILTRIQNDIVCQDRDHANCLPLSQSQNFLLKLVNFKGLEVGNQELQNVGIDI